MVIQYVSGGGGKIFSIGVDGRLVGSVDPENFRIRIFDAEGEPVLVSYDEMRSILYALDQMCDTVLHYRDEAEDREDFDELEEV